MAHCVCPWWIGWLLVSLTVRTAEQAGFREEARPSIGGGRSVLLVRGEPAPRA